MPFSLASYGYAKESPTPEGQESIETSLSGTPSVPEDLKTLPARSKADFPKDLQTHRQDYVPGEVIVKFKREKLDVKSIFGKAQAFVFEKKFSLEKKDEIKTSNIQVFRSKKSTEELVKELKSDPSVEYAQPNYIKRAFFIPNDTNFNSLWGLNNLGQIVNETPGSNDADIDGPEAWDLETGSQPDVVVAVLDSGVAHNHPDLADNMWDGSSNCKDENGNSIAGGCPNHGWDYVNSDPNPLDDLGHGTHISGTIAATANNNKGVVGASNQNNNEIMAVKVMDTMGYVDTESELLGIEFANKNGAKVINASFGGSYFDLAEKEAIDAFPGLFISPAGNDGTNNDSIHNYPCDYDSTNIICVAATDQNDGLASFSNYGATSVDVGAPGTNIYSTVADSNLLNETFESVVTPNIPGSWIKGGTNNNWGVLDETAWLGSEWGKVIYGDRFYPYDDGADTMVTSSTYNLNSIGASIDFLTICDTEYITNGWADYMQLEYSSDGINFSPAIDPYTGDEFRWDEPTLDILSGENPLDDTDSSFFHYENVSIPSQYLTSNFKFRFRWVTNLTDNAYYGCLIDDVKITKFSDGSDEQYGYMQGTSMAAPYVAGLAALIEGYNSNLSTSEVKNIILNSGDSVSDLAGKTVSGKRINAYEALVAAAPLSSEKAIVAFTIPGQVGEIVINEEAHTIGVTVPFGTDVTALVPAITVSPEASVSPLSGVENNFTTPQTYTVTAADGLTQDYVVTVTVAANTVSGNITEDTTWTLANSPYIVTDTVQVLEGATLTIEPGVIVKIYKGKQLRIDGAIEAVGTYDNFTMFTSYDETFNGNGWEGLYFTSKATSININYGQVPCKLDV